MHLERLNTLLQPECAVEMIDESSIKKETIPNIRNFQIWQYLSALWRADIVHIHSSILLFRLVHIALAAIVLRKKTIVTLHSMRSLQLFWLQKFLYRNCCSTIVVNKNYINTLNLSNTVHMPAFLPPSIGGDAIPAPMLEWLDEKKRQGIKIAASNAFRLDDLDGVDLYGLDLAIELADKFKKDNDPAAIIYVVSDIDKSAEKFHKFEREIKDKNLADHILLTGGAINFPALVKQSDLVLRLTCTDGDALTIREALWLGVNVLASDVVERPENCNLFTNRDIDSLYQMTKKIIFQKDQINTTDGFDYKNWYLDLYKGQS